ncbi:hypothetical protein ACFL9U_12570, partial [Thermodesulfobacteriota bacterium]
MSEGGIVGKSGQSDGLLEFLINVVEGYESAEQGKPSIYITLNMGGLLISGELISENAYLQESLIWKVINL